MYERSDFSFIRTLDGLGTEAEKLEHLRGWTAATGPDNGLDQAEASRYEILLEMVPLHAAGGGGTVDRDAIYGDMHSAFYLSDWLAMDDDGQRVRERIPRAGYSRVYAMFAFTLDSLVPDVEIFPPTKVPVQPCDSPVPIGSPSQGR